MEKNRLEAFSDGLFALIITPMVLGVKASHAVEQVRHTAALADRKPLLPVFLSCVMISIRLASISPWIAIGR